MSATRPHLSLVVNHDPSPSSASAEAARPVFFDRRELGEIMTVYGQGLVAGFWRDYGITADRHQVVFAILKHAHERPIHYVIKEPKRERKQGLYRLVAPGGYVIKRGSSLTSVLSSLKPR